MVMSRTIHFELENREHGGRASAVFALSGGDDLRARAPFASREHLTGMEGVAHQGNGGKPMLASSSFLLTPLLSPSIVTFVSTHSTLLLMLGLIMIPALVIVLYVALKGGRPSREQPASRRRRED
jgi:hypothetical protein